MSASSEPRPVEDPSPAVERTVVLPKHLHARPAGQVAQAATRHPATTIELDAGHRRANARSVLAVMSLGAVSGSELRVITTGPDAEALADAVVAILTSPEEDA
jgi:phosphocarrier protein HPr